MHLLTISIEDVATLFPLTDSFIYSAWAPSFCLQWVSFPVLAFCIHSFSKHLRSVPYGPSLFLGFRQTERNRIPESVIKKIHTASVNKIRNSMSFQTFESPFFLNTQALIVSLMLNMQIIKIVDKTDPHSLKTPIPNKRSIQVKN